MPDTEPPSSAQPLQYFAPPPPAVPAWVRRVALALVLCCAGTALVQAAVGLLNVADLPLVSAAAMLASVVVFYALLGPLSAAVRPRKAAVCLAIALALDTAAGGLAHATMTDLSRGRVLEVDPYFTTAIHRDHANAGVLRTLAVLSFVSCAGLGVFVVTRRRNIVAADRLF